MASKDPIFQGEGVFHGAVSLTAVEQLSGQWVYFVGENHDHLEESTVLMDRIMAYAEHHPTIICVEYGEKSLGPIPPGTRHSMVDQAILSFGAMFQRASSQSRLLGVDLRKDPPYAILEVGLTFYIHYIAFYMPQVLSDPKKHHAIKTAAKTFEKEFFQHVRTSADWVTLLMAFVHPDRTLPSWVTTAMKRIFGTARLWIPETLRKIRSKYPEYVEGLLYGVEHFWNEFIRQNSAVESALVLMDKTRKTDVNEPLVALKHDEIMLYLNKIQSIFMDLRFLLLKRTFASHTVVYVCGNQHVQQTLDLMRWTESGGKVWKADGSKNNNKIDWGQRKRHAKALYIPNNPLRAFVNKKK